MRCPNCQTVNPPEAKFCVECGKQLTLVCPNCGTVNPPAAKFCMECGTPLPSSQDEQQPVQPAATVSTTSTVADQQAGQTVHLRRQTQPLPDPLTNPEERRVVTVMFADIIGSTPLADLLDPEEMRAILSGYFNLMTEQIRKHGGTVEKYIGDAVMAVFGSPIAHEDDPDRAIRAALDMQAALARFNQSRVEQDAEATRLQMRIGINTGEVAAPSNPGYNRQDFLITGDAVNVASRLQTVAAPDTILVGERTYFTTRDVFAFNAIAPIRIKGKTEPIPAWVVLGPQSRNPSIMQHPRGIEGLQAQFVGRTLELALIHATYARVLAERRPHLITLLGTPGIGKSRLVREFIKREQEAAKSASNANRLAMPTILYGRCPPYGQGVTYRPLQEILYALLSVEETESPEVIESEFIAFVQKILAQAHSGEDPLQIADAIIRSVGRRASERGERGERVSETGYLADGRDRERQRSTTGTLNKNAEQGGPHIALLRAWRVFLEALAQQLPLIIVIDDLQWADDALLDLLEYLTDRTNDVPILFLCPARPDFFERRNDWGGGRRNFTTIALEALSNEESSELVSELLKTEEIPEVLRHTILNRSEGNPFFVEEIVRMLIDQKVLINEDGCWHIGENTESIMNELASPAAPPEDSLLDQHYVFPLPRVPDTIQGVLAARVDLLSQTEKLVLQHASIIGRTFWLTALFELASGLTAEAILDILDSLIERDFIVELEKQVRGPVEYDRTFAFKHVLIRDVVYNNIPRVRRSLEHAQLALWLEQQADGRVEAFAELLAYHYQQALLTWSASIMQNAATSASHSNGHGQRATTMRLTRPELRRRAITYLSLAGDQAMHSYFTIRAIQAYSEAVDLLTDSEADALTMAQMYQKLGDAYAQRGTMDEAWKTYRQALHLLTTGPQQVGDDVLLDLYNRLAELGTRWQGLFNESPDNQEIRSYIDAGLTLLRDQPHSGEFSEFLTYQAFWYVWNQHHAADTEQRAEFARLALESGELAQQIAEELHDTIALWLTLDALSVIYRKQYKYLEAHAVQHKRLKLVDQIKSREEQYDLYMSLGWAHEAVCDFATAAKWFGYAWRMAQTMESPTLLLSCMIGRMYVWHRWNRWSEAQDVARQILQMVERYQLNEQWQAEALEVLAVIAYRTGLPEEGERYARQYKRILEKYASQSGMLPTMPVLYLAREEWTRALSEYQALLRSTEPFPSPKLLASLAELLVVTGQSSEEQQTFCERAVSIAGESGSRRSQVIALRARGRMHMEQQRWQEAKHDLESSLTMAQELDLSWEEGLTLYALGLFYRRRADALHTNDAAQFQADVGRAHNHFDRALGFFESLHAVQDAERARLALAQGNAAPV
jgi:class 3 adenylate cyclase/tetratricopeptide (TPR) repeat protein